MVSISRPTWWLVHLEYLEGPIHCNCIAFFSKVPCHLPGRDNDHRSKARLLEVIQLDPDRTSAIITIGCNSTAG
jgi:hypothetical protein